MKKYLDVTQEGGKQFYLDFHQKGKITMLNLLKFRSQANYEGLDSIKPETDISGREAYDLYMEHTIPHLEKSGSRVTYLGECNAFVIGPETESWDVMLIVEHQSVAKFMEFAQNEDYLKTAGHRTAALEDSRLLPSSERL